LSEEADPHRPGRRTPFPSLPEWAGVSTRLVHGARRPDLNAGSVVGPIYQTSTFHYPSEHSESAAHGGTYLYSRLENPSLEAPAEILRQLERGEEARLFASGMGASVATVLSLVRAGDEVVALEELYGGTLDLFTDLLPRFGVRVRLVPLADASEPEAIVGPETKLVWLESPTNPTLSVVDLARWADAADAKGALLAVDNTFATPINQTPLALGADLVIHSATKYLAGHSDVTAGVVVGPRELLRQVDAKRYFGACLDPFAAFLLARSLKTLDLRVARQNENGRRVAEALAGHPAVRKVFYPGRNSAAEEAIAARQMRGRGGMVSLALRAGPSAVDPFLRRLKFVHVAPSLGSVESLASVPALTSHRNLTREERLARGIEDTFVRLSLGIEEPDDLVRDLSEALDSLRTGPTAPL
jgi:cystathionine gamma-synthase